MLLLFVQFVLRQVNDTSIFAELDHVVRLGHALSHIQIQIIQHVDVFAFALPPTKNMGKKEIKTHEKYSEYIIM